MSLSAHGSVYLFTVVICNACIAAWYTLWFLIFLERYQKRYPVPNTQYYWVLPIPIRNTDIGFLPRFLLELDMRSEVHCVNRARGMVLTKH